MLWWQTHPHAVKSRDRKSKRSAISTYTGSCFSEELSDDDRWRGPVQRFTSGSEAPWVVL
jgi:hypothetical protein